MQFALENEIASSLRMDSSLVKPSSQLHKRKVLESSNSSLSMEPTGGGGGIKRLAESGLGRRTPSKTPKRSPARGSGGTPCGSITPGRRTPGREVGDRFIPNRTAIDLEMSSHKLLRDSLQDLKEDELMSPSKREYQKVMAENLGADISNTRILAFHTKAPTAPESHSNSLKILYSASKNPTTAKRTIRHIPQVPERILDAPDILNDYYLNLVDWSNTNVLAVALGSHIYLWTASSGNITQLCELEGQDDYVCSVRWVKEGGYLAVGTSTGDVTLWDAEAMKKTRTMRGLDTRVASLAWNEFVVTAGSRSGQLQHSDVRVASHQVGLVSGHTQEVCGLAWSPDGRTLASGGNDNVLNLWSAVAGGCHGEGSPTQTFTQHQAAVKALAWCPWQSHTLASGGGTADRSIKLWNTANGNLCSSTDTKSQVCSLLFAPEYKELVSSHGYPSNEVVLWRFPAMTKTAELLGHTERVLNTCLSPDGSTLVSAGADETLRLWKAFTSDPNKKKISDKSKQGPVTSLRMGIR